MELYKLMGCVKRPFIPSELFSGGLIGGAWFDPSDMSTLYQDAAGTIPVTALEQPVGLMLDKSRGMMRGPELVSKGTSDSDTAGWTAVLSALSVSGGVIRITNTTSKYGSAQQVIDTVIGKMYEYKGVFVGGTGASSLAVKIGTTNYSASAFASGIKFLATETTTTIQLNVGTNVIGAYMEFASASLRELYGYHATQSITASRPTLSARYNLLTKTEDFSDAVWIKNNTATQINASIAPDGTLSADRVWAGPGVIMTGNDAVGQIGSVTVASNGAPYTLTFYAKAAGLNYIRIREAANTGVRVKINLTDGSFSGEYGWNESIFTVKTSKANNGFLRIEITRTAPVTFSLSIKCGNDVGVGISESVFIWGADLRLGTTSGPYQRVNTATDYDTDERYFPKYLRFDGVDDYLSLPFMSLYVGGKMSIVAAQDAVSQSTGTHIISERSTTDADPKYFPSRQLANGGNMDVYISDDTAAVVLDTVGSAFDGAADKVIRSVVDTGSNIKLYKNGVLAADDNYTRAGTLTLNTTTIGASVSTTTSNYAKIKLYGLIVTKSAITDAQRIACERHLSRKSGVQL